MIRSTHNNIGTEFWMAAALFIGIDLAIFAGVLTQLATNGDDMESLKLPDSISEFVGIVAATGFGLMSAQRFLGKQQLKEKKTEMEQGKEQLQKEQDAKADDETTECSESSLLTTVAVSKVDINPKAQYKLEQKLCGAKKEKQGRCRPVRGLCVLLRFLTARS